MKGQSELIIGAAIVLIVIAAVVIQFFGPEGKATIYFAPDCGSPGYECDGSAPACGDCSVSQPTISAVWQSSADPNGVINVTINYASTIWRKKDSESFIEIQSTPVTSYQDIDLVGGSSYQYKAKKWGDIEIASCQGITVPLIECSWECVPGYTDCSEENTSNTVTVPSSPPDPPGWVTASTGTNLGEIDVSWEQVQEVIDDQGYYLIEMRTDSLPWEICGFTSDTDTSVICTAAPNEIALNHYFRVQSCTSECGSFSSESSPAFPAIGAEIVNPPATVTQYIPFQLNGIGQHTIGTVSYSWYIPVNCSPQFSNDQNPTITCNYDGTTTARLTVNAANGSAQKQINLNIADGIPPSPSGLAATPGDQQVDLSWNQTVGAYYYKLGWNTDGTTNYPNLIWEGTGTPLSVTTTNYTHSGLTNGTTYYYALIACTGAGCSPWSNQTYATPTGGSGPSPPENVQANPKAGNPGWIEITWNPVNDIIRYWVYWSKSPNTTGTANYLGYVNHPVTTAGHQPQEPAAMYYYTVKTWDGSETSDFSSPPANSYPELGASISGPSSAQVDTPFTLNGSALYAVGTPTYSWSLPSGCSSGTTNQQNITMSCSTTGNKTITLTVTATNGSAQATKNVDISGGAGVPDVPAGVDVEFGPNTGEVTQTWNPVSDATSYEVVRVLSGGSGWDFYDTTTLTSYVHTTCTTSESAYSMDFAVRACNSNGCSDYSSSLPSYPKMGSADAGGPYSAVAGETITLNASILCARLPSYSWSITNNEANCSPTTLNGKNPTLSCSTDNKTSTLTLTVTATNGTTTDTAIISISSSGLPAPSDLTAVTGANSGEVDLTWSQVTGATIYKIYWRLEDNSDSGNFNTTNPDSVTHTTEYSEQGILHYYTISAASDTEPWSPVSEETPQATAYPQIGANAGGSYAGTPNTNITLSATPEYAIGTTTYSWNITTNTADCSLTNQTTRNPTINCTQTGTATITLTITDSQTRTATDTAIVNISETPDTENPTIQITYPSNNQTVSSTVLIKATATDNVGIKNVKFYIDNSLKATDTSASYEYSWNTTSETNASHTIKATAEDTTGNTAQTQITVTVNNVSGPECGNGVIETGEECEFDLECYPFYSRAKCNTTTKKHESRSVTCNSCSCVAGNWTETNLYCDVCSHCGDGTQNCNETAETCPADFGGEQDTTPPEKPTGLEVIRVTENSITLEWNPNTEIDLRRYKIYYSEESENYLNEEIALKNETSLTLTGLENNTKYYIVITAIDLSGNESDYSNEVSATTKEEVIEVPAPKNLTAELNDGNVLLNWNHTDPKPDYYIIQRKEKEGYFDQIKTTSDNEYTDTETEKNKTYIYRIAAFKNNKTSNYSEEVEITTTEEVKCTENNVCEEGCEADPDCENWLPWAIGGAIVVVSTALAYIFFTFDI